MDFLADILGTSGQNTLHLTLVFVHVGAAVLSLITGIGAMVTAKGGHRHRQYGKLYFWGMFVTNGVALILLTWRLNLFLFGVTIFSFYAALTGYRVLYRKRPDQGRGAAPFDWAAAAVAAVTGVALIINSTLGFFELGAFGIPPLASGASVAVILPLVFGVMIAHSGISDMRQFVKPITDKRWWWFYHMNAMLGSYIGLTTALMVQQIGPRMPDQIAWIVWVLPSVIGTVGISRWIGSYRRQFAPARRTAPASAGHD